MALYPNGRIPATALDPVPADRGQTAWLLPIPAASFNVVRSVCHQRHGWAPVVTSAGDGFRSEARQVAVFTERYGTAYATVLQGGRRIVDRRVWNGVPYWRHTGPAAAIPGTSNHGFGITVDVANLRYDTQAWGQLAPILRAEGWSNVEGARIAEPWHWNYLRTAYPVTNTNTLPGVTITVPDLDAPDPLELEDDMAVRMMRHPDGRTLAASGPRPGDFTVATNMDQVRSWISRGIITEDDLIPQDKGGRLIVLRDTLVWDKGLEDAKGAR